MSDSGFKFLENYLEHKEHKEGTKGTTKRPRAFNT